MTGTAQTEADEFWKIYNLEVISIPTNKPLVRVNHPDMIYRTEKEKWKAALEEVVEVHKEGRPILIGTTDVDKSLKLSELLKRRGIKHELLNALPEHAARESEIVAQAGRIGAVTIATNMAGRGTDIILGGNPETMAWAMLKGKYASLLDVPEAEWKALVSDIDQKEKMKEEGRKVVEMGGLHIVGTERHDARRIDNQLRGRAGRQGDPGSSRFYLSLEDDLMRIFAPEWVGRLLTMMGMEEGQAIEDKMVSRRIAAAQKKVEERHFDSRKNLLEYDEVMDTQRKEVYGFRQRILEGGNCKTADPRHAGQANGAERRALSGPGVRGGVFRGVRGAAAGRGVRRRRLLSQRLRAGRQDGPRQGGASGRNAVCKRWSTRTSAAEDSKEWNWQALSHQINTQWGLKTSDRELKKIGKDDLASEAARAGAGGGRGHRPVGGQGVFAGGLGPAGGVRLGASEIPDQADAGGAGGQGARRGDGAGPRPGAGDVPSAGDRVPGDGGDGPFHVGSAGAAAAASATTAKACTTGPCGRFPLREGCARRTSAPNRGRNCRRSCWR